MPIVVCQKLENVLGGEMVKKKAENEEVEEVVEAQHQITEEELFPDNTLICEFTIAEKPATKKNHGIIIHSKGRHVLLPSSQYKKYETLCKPFCEDAWVNKGKLAMNYGVAIYVQVFLDTWSVGDHCGYLQSIGDILEKFKVVENDKWIHWIDGGKHWFGGIDKDNPRVEIKIYRYKHPYEDYREDKEIKLQKKIDKKLNPVPVKPKKEKKNTEECPLIVMEDI
jgi:hypothetical protein